jgi:hypothetical protein
VTELDRFLTSLETSLQRLPRRERRRALREARDHVLCAADERRATGEPPQDALRHAIDAFGATDTIAAGYARPTRSRRELGVVAIGAAVLALAFAPTGSALGQILIPTSHASPRAPVATTSTHACAPATQRNTNPTPNTVQHTVRCEGVRHHRR